MQFDRLKRREFITLLGSAAAWPLASSAQQAVPMRCVAVLLATTADDADSQARVGAFLQGMQEAGWGYRPQPADRYPLGRADANDIRRHAAELVALAPDLIVATGTSTVRPLMQATRTVPIVFTFAGDPVGGGLVESLARPGGNVTGFMTTEYTVGGKWLELLKDNGTPARRSKKQGCPLRASCVRL